MNSENIKNNYAKYTIALRNNTIKNGVTNGAEYLLASPENAIFRKSNLVSIINKAIIFSNKALRRTRNNANNGDYAAYRDTEAISALNIYTHPATGKHYKIYGYPGMEAAPQFKCRGVRAIKGSPNILNNNFKSCVEEADLGRIVFKPVYIDEPVNKYVMYIVLDSVRIIAIIDNNATFMNSLSLKEQEFVKSITDQGMLELMSEDDKVFAGTDFKNNANMSSVMPVISVPMKEKSSKLKFSQSVNVQEIPKIGRRHVRGGRRSIKRNKTRKNNNRHLRY